MSRRGENIFKRKDGRWEARYIKEIGIDGTKKYGSVYAKTYKEVKEKQQALIKEPQVYKAEHCLIVTSIMNEWLCESKNQLKQSSFQKYSQVVENHILRLLGEMPVNFITAQTVIQFTDTLLAENLSRETVNLVLTVLRMGLKNACKKHHITVPEIHLLKTLKPKTHVLSEAEQKKLVKHLFTQDDSFSLGILLSLYTGLRIGELCALKWCDFSENAIHVHGTMQRLKSIGGMTEVVILPPKTESSNRTVPIPATLKPLIEKRRERNGFVLTQEDGKFIEPRLLQMKFAMYLEECGLKKTNFHTLRHTFATRCIEAGVDVKTLSELLGHADVKTTLNRYVHSSFELKQKSIDKLFFTN